MYSIRPLMKQDFGYRHRAAHYNIWKYMVIYGRVYYQTASEVDGEVYSLSTA